MSGYIAVACSSQLSEPLNIEIFSTERDAAQGIFGEHVADLDATAFHYSLGRLDLFDSFASVALIDICTLRLLRAEACPFLAATFRLQSFTNAGTKP